MREFKFRAWDTHRNIMSNNMSFVPANDMAGLTYSPFAWTRTTEQDPWCDNLVLMQYTGLEDRFDFEIYEGDIVKMYLNYPDKSLGEVNQGVVKFGKFVSSGDGQGFGDDDVMGFYVETKGDNFSLANWTIEVVGNIYENSELL